MELDRYLPFYRLGFRCNPFRALTPQETSQLAVIPNAIKNAYVDSQDHLQMMGAAGRGKTTTLLGLTAMDISEKRISYEYLPEKSRRYKTDTELLDVLFLDEAQRLNRRSIARLVVSAKEGLRIILSTHEDLSNEFAHRGLKLCKMTIDASPPNQIEEIISRRLQFFSLDEQPGVFLTQQTTELLQTTFGTDMRAMLDLLYEVFQDRREKGEVKVSDLVRYDLPQSFT